MIARNHLQSKLWLSVGKVYTNTQSPLEACKERNVIFRRDWACELNRLKGWIYYNHLVRPWHISLMISVMIAALFNNPFKISCWIFIIYDSVDSLGKLCCATDGFILGKDCKILWISNVQDNNLWCSYHTHTSLQDSNYTRSSRVLVMGFNLQWCSQMTTWSTME